MGQYLRKAWDRLMTCYGKAIDKEGTVLGNVWNMFETYQGLVVYVRTCYMDMYATGKDTNYISQ